MCAPSLVLVSGSARHCTYRALGSPFGSSILAQRANALVRVKYIVTIEGRGPPGHRVTQAWLGALAQSDANFETP
jgi:hypothetical protein